MLISLLITVFRMVVLPVEFEDRQFAQSRTKLQQEVQEVQAYFDRQFARGTAGAPAQTFRFDLAPTQRLPHPIAWYGGNRPEQCDVRLADAVREACAGAADKGKVDFGLYDNDADGSVDVVCLLFPGPGEEAGGEPDDIWPQMGWLSAGGGTRPTHGGKRIDRFIAVPDGRTGIFAHEFGHALGLPDLYDTDGEASGGTTRGLWGISLMDEGCKGATIPDFTAIEYELLGLGRCDTLRTGSYVFAPLCEGGGYGKILTDREGECFLLEAREGGLLVYHIDRSEAPAGFCERLNAELTARERWENGAVNDNPEHPCARILPADQAATTVGGAVFPQGGMSSLGSDTPVALRGWSGQAPALALTGIRVDADGMVRFEALEPVVLTDLTVYQDAAIVRWQAAERLAVAGFEVRWTDGTDTFSEELPPTATSFTIEGLRPQTAYSVTVLLRCAGSDRFSAGERFVTKVYRAGTYPYIYLNGVPRNVDGSFPAGCKLALRVFNATDVAEVHWSMDGVPVKPEADGRYTLTRSGLLCARILHTDGTSESIFKEITVQ